MATIPELYPILQEMRHLVHIMSSIDISLGKLVKEQEDQDAGQECKDKSAIDIP